MVSPLRKSCFLGILYQQNKHFTNRLSSAILYLQPGTAALVADHGKGILPLLEASQRYNISIDKLRHYAMSGPAERLAAAGRQCGLCFQRPAQGRVDPFALTG